VFAHYSGRHSSTGSPQARSATTLNTFQSSTITGAAEAGVEAKARRRTGCTEREDSGVRSAFVADEVAAAEERRRKSISRRIYLIYPKDSVTAIKGTG